MTLRPQVLSLFTGLALLAFQAVPVVAIQVLTSDGNGLDAEATENLSGGEVIYGYNGTKVNMNARYNGYNNGFPAGSTEEGSDADNDDRNEMWVLRFDLSTESNKSQISNAAIDVTAWRASNLQKDLRIWGVNGGTLGLNTFTETSLFAEVPGFLQDFDMTTMSIDPSVTTYLGDFLYPNHPGDIVPSEGDLLRLNQNVLDTTGPNGTSEPGGAGVTVQSTLDGYLRSLGPTDMAVFIVGGVASNGQVRIGTKETLATETGVFQCPNFECAPILSYDLSEGLPGDFDGDTDVDGRDFLFWQRDPGVGSLSDWQANYGTGGLAAIGAVPEPHTVLLCLTAAMLLMNARRATR